MDGSVAVRLWSRAELSCADGALDAASSSESCELKPASVISEMMGRDTGRAVDSGPEADFCFFFGCESSVEVVRCFDRTGTGIVIRVVVRGRSGPVDVPGDKLWNALHWVPDFGVRYLNLDGSLLLHEGSGQS